MGDSLAAGSPTLRPRRRTSTAVLFGLALTVSTLAACGPNVVSPAASSAVPSAPLVIAGCEVLAPRVLPSGSEPGPPIREGGSQVSWGVGQDRVVAAIGEFGVGDPASLGVAPDSKQWTRVRGVRALVVPIGDDGVGQVAITWTADGCPYTLWLAPGRTLDDAVRYARQI